MIDFANYTPSPNDAALAVQGTVGDIGRDKTTDMIMHLFPGVTNSAAFVLVLLVIFIIGTPVIIWLLQTGRIKNA